MYICTNLCTMCFLSTCVQSVFYQLVDNVFPINLLVQFVSYQLVYNLFPLYVCIQKFAKFVSYQLVYNVFPINLCTICFLPTCVQICIYTYSYSYINMYIYMYVFSINLLVQFVSYQFVYNLFPLYVCILGRRYTHVCMCRVSVWSIY